MLLRSPSSLVACNVYISAGRSHHKEVLLSVLKQCQERCRQLRIGQITPSSAKYFLEHNHNHQSIEKSNKIAVVHAYADGPYDRSSFHLAGNADLVADVASCVAIDAIDGLDYLSKHGHDDHNDTTESSAHPYVGLVDHVSVMPLSIENEILVAEQEDPETSISQDGASFVPPDSHGLCSTYIGEKLSEKGINVFYYGSAHPKQTPLATIRRERTHFFRSGGLDVNSDGYNNINDIGDICTVGSPPSFVENYNILMSSNVSKKKAIGLAKKIRERDGGILGVEALTLPYSQGRYEVACNLLRPSEGSVNDILHVLDQWVQNELREDYSACAKSGCRSYFIDNSYRVGTTIQQCLDVLNKCKEGEDSLLNSHDSAVIDKFCGYIL